MIFNFPFWYGCPDVSQKIGRGLGWQEVGSIPPISGPWRPSHPNPTQKNIGRCSVKLPQHTAIILILVTSTLQREKHLLLLTKSKITRTSMTQNDFDDFRLNRAHFHSITPQVYIRPDESHCWHWEAIEICQKVLWTIHNAVDRDNWCGFLRWY